MAWWQRRGPLARGSGMPGWRAFFTLSRWWRSPWSGRSLLPRRDPVLPSRLWPRRRHRLLRARSRPHRVRAVPDVRPGEQCHLADAQKRTPPHRGRNRVGNYIFEAMTPARRRNPGSPALSVPSRTGSCSQAKACGRKRPDPACDDGPPQLPGGVVDAIR